MFQAVEKTPWGFFDSLKRSPPNSDISHGRTPSGIPDGVRACASGGERGPAGQSTFLVKFP